MIKLLSFLLPMKRKSSGLAKEELAENLITGTNNILMLSNASKKLVKIARKNPDSQRDIYEVIYLLDKIVSDEKFIMLSENPNNKYVTENLIGLM